MSVHDVCAMPGPPGEAACQMCQSVAVRDPQLPGAVCSHRVREPSRLSADVQSLRLATVAFKNLRFKCIENRNEILKVSVILTILRILITCSA